MSTETNQKKLNRLSPEDRAKLIQDLQDNYELVEMHARLAEARMRIQKANLEELVYTMKLHDMKNAENGKPTES